MEKAYSRINWVNGSDSTDTPLNETNLNLMDAALNTIDNRVVEHDAEITELQGYETAAAQSAAEALASATAAATSESNAATSEANALTYKNNASTSATNAATSETNALAYKNSASTSATNAAESETNALSYKNSASTSATNAATSESNASTSETNASTSATNAATSESNALTYKNNASTSATNAATSESNASDSATLSESYAVGGTGTRAGEDTDNAKYYCEQAALIADVDASAVSYDGTDSGLSATNVQSAIDEVTNESFMDRANSSAEPADMNDIISIGTHTISPNVTTLNVPVSGTWGLVEVFKHGLSIVQLWIDSNNTYMYTRTRSGNPTVWSSWKRTEASNIPYTNTTSGLSATNVQDAIDEVIVTDNVFRARNNITVTDADTTYKQGQYWVNRGTTTPYSDNLPETDQYGYLTVLNSTRNASSTNLGVITQEWQPYGTQKLYKRNRINANWTSWVEFTSSENITYDNTDSTLSSTDVQSAISELNTDLTEINNNLSEYGVTVSSAVANQASGDSLYPYYCIIPISYPSNRTVLSSSITSLGNDSTFGGAIQSAGVYAGTIIGDGRKITHIVVFSTDVQTCRVTVGYAYTKN